MKCEILFVLSFWAFKTVFAGPAIKDPEYLHQETALKFNDAVAKSENPVLVAAITVKGPPEMTDSIGDCINEAENHNAYHQKYAAAVKKCDQCYDKAEKDKNYKVADTCCDNAVAAFLVVDKLRNDRATACMKKCEKLGKDCPEMLKKLWKNDAKGILGQV